MRFVERDEAVLTRALTIALVALYALLGALAGACPGDDYAPALAHHQRGQAHHSGGLHAALCALACQANSSASPVSTPPDQRPVLLFLWVVVAAVALRPLPPHGCLRARAPPR
jgi:hypothetical protein